MNKYKCSNGDLISQATIDFRRSKMYRSMYEGEGHPCCSGCGKPAQGSGHLVPQKRCKELGKAEYCYAPMNILPMCFSCNMTAENPRSENIKTLACYEEILAATRIIDPERYQKLIL